MVKKQDKPHEKPHEARPHEKKPAPALAKKPMKEEKENFRGIVRIAGKDVKGQLSMKRALLAVRGIGHTMASAAAIILTRELSIAPDSRVGELSEEQIEKVDKVLANLQDHHLPKYLLNRVGDFTGGHDRHVVMNDLLFETQQDVEREKKAYSWKGYRHTYGQKVRGQKTRNTGRTGMAVGVLRKAIIAAQAGAAGAKPGAPGPAAPAAPAAGGKAAAPAKPAAKPAEKK